MNLQIGVLSNHLITLKKQNNPYRPFNWHEDCFTIKSNFVDNREELLFNT